MNIFLYRIRKLFFFAILDRLLITESTLNSVLFMVGYKQIVSLVPSLPNSMDFP